jgi:hypothetical protein
MAVNSGKHSEHDTEAACFVLCAFLETLRHRCTVLHGVPELAAQAQCSFGFNCGYSAEYFRSMSSPHRSSVWVGYALLGYIGKAQHSIAPVALSSCSVQIEVKLSL